MSVALGQVKSRWVAGGRSSSAYYISAQHRWVSRVPKLFTAPYAARSVSSRAHYLILIPWQHNHVCEIYLLIVDYVSVSADNDPVPKK